MFSIHVYSALECNDWLAVRQHQLYLGLKSALLSPNDFIHHTMAAILGVPGHIQPTHPTETACSKIVFM